MKKYIVVKTGINKSRKRNNYPQNKQDVLLLKDVPFHFIPPVCPSGNIFQKDEIGFLSDLLIS